MKSLVVLSLLMSSTVYSAEYIVKLKQNAKINKSISILGTITPIELSYTDRFVKINTPNTKAINTLMDNPAVEYVEPNFIYSHNYVPSDADFDKQWGIENTGKNSGPFWNRGTAGVDVSALNAWKITTGSRDIKIAVIDTGVDYNHEDLKNNMMINQAELNGSEGVDDDGNGYIDDVYGYDFANNDADPMDGHGHGTHCAGVIGAVHNNIGIAGIMKDVQILAIKFLTDSGSGTLEAAMKAIDYATSRGVHVMSNSWGGGGRSEALYEAIARAQDAGILFTAAAGNSNSDNDTTPSYPASYKLDNVVSVGAHDGKGQKANFSSYGQNTVHVFAPGVDIYSTVSNNKYGKMSGTSMATPHVSGVAGLVLANEPNMSLRELKERLMNTTINSGDLDTYSVSGYVDAYNALRDVQDTK